MPSDMRVFGEIILCEDEQTNEHIGRCPMIVITPFQGYEG